eukprot:377847-Amorphochlora_amoeboformis.AAC.1
MHNAYIHVYTNAHVHRYTGESDDPDPDANASDYLSVISGHGDGIDPKAAEEGGKLVYVCLCFSALSRTF